MHVLVQCIYVLTVLLLAVFDAIGYLFELLNQAGTYLFAAVRKTKKHLVTSLAQVKRTLLPKKRKRKKQAPQKILIREKKQKKTSSFSFLFKLKYFFIGTIFSLLFIFFPLVALLFLQDLPNPKELTLRQIPQTTKIYDRHGKLLDQIYASQNRTMIRLSDIPPSLKNATLAIEDKNFYKHPGFDLPSIIRALRENISGRSFQGGSTLTQQLIKSSMLTPEPTIVRKGKEIILAFWAERLYTKNQILEMYFNQVPYGGTAWGVEAASELYFAKKVNDLTLGESTFLAGITAAPTTYSPYGPNPFLWKKRQKEVLNRMVSLGYINKKQAQEASQEELTFRPQRTTFYAPHFVEYVKQLLVDKYGITMVERGGLQVTTSLDYPLQETAQKIVADEVGKSAYLNLTNGASLVTNPGNGDILAMVGSREFTDPNGGNVNVTTSLRQPGSSIKIVTYSAALSNGLTAASMLDDTPITYSIPGGTPYTPVNYDGRSYGRIPLRAAFANSLNIPAVKTLNQIGIPTMVSTARDMGITSWGDPDQYGLSITLGAAEVKMTDMATVFGTIANEGRRITLNPILKVTDYKGTVIEEKHPQEGRRALSTGVAFIIADILADNAARSLAFGPNSILQIPGHRVSVKTGTTDNKRDNWTIGFTPEYLVAVWVGNNDNSPMSQSLASGITGAAPIWHRIMTELLKNTQDKPLAIPADITTKPCFGGKTEYFLKGTENTASCQGGSFLRTTPRR